MQHEHHRVPVTAVAFCGDDVILAGEGSYLHAYGAGAERQDRVQIFDDQAIHGIIVDEQTSTLLVWGGRFLRAVHLSTKPDGAVSFELDSIQSLDDWILDAAFSPRTVGCPPPAAIVTAHNALSVAKYGRQPAGTALNVSRSLIFGSNCILYCAHITWLSESHCLIASGTAFGDIIVWSATLSQENGKDHAHRQTHYTFSAHEGSVFGVQLSSALSPPLAGCTRMLASCSDDRTIRLWDISDLTLQSPTLETMQWNTGFGAREMADAYAPKCVAKAMGHMSRIWHVRYAHDTAANGPLSLLTFGEDASVIAWALNVDGDSARLHQTYVEAAHSGKNIWSVATGRDRVATGGADGAIAFHSHLHCKTEPQAIPGGLLDHLGNFQGDNFRGYCFIDTGLLVSTTDQGRIVLIDLTSADGTPAVREISGAIPGLRGYSVVSGVPAHAFVAGTDGAIYHYSSKANTLSKIGQEDRKTAGLFISPPGVGEEVHLLVTTVGATTATLYSSQNDWSDYTSCTLSLPSAFVVTSLALYQVEGGQYAVLGARNGLIAVFYVDESVSASPAACSKLYDSVHSKEAVTWLQWAPTDGNSVPLELVFSTGRDGTIATHRVITTASSLELELLHQLSLPFGQNIEGLSHVSKDKLLVWGFKSRHFIVYDILAQREVMSVDCGGAHRHWAFLPAEDGGTFVWTKSSKLCYRTQTKLPYSLLNAGGHGREIKAAAISPATRERQILATGAEDTDIKLWIYEDTEFQCLHTLRKHNTGIQHLQWSRDGEYLFSSGGFEEFFVWKITPGVPRIGIGVQCESAQPMSGTSDLRVMGFDVEERTGATSDDSFNFRISMAYSDSTLKLWQYCNKIWKLIAAGDYLTACLTNVVYLHNGVTNLVTTATDGHIALWQLEEQTSTLQWSRRSRVHQNAIHLANTCGLGDGSTLLVTGGDDNAIALTRLDTTSTSQTLLIPRAQAAAVTGLALLPVSTDAFVLVSVGIDQRLKLWQVDIDTKQAGVDGIAVKRTQNCFTSVADASSLAICRLDDGASGVVLCGVGMEVWRLPP